MNVKASVQEIDPAQSSFMYDEDESQEKWRNNIRACVTALKCHILASRGLTVDGYISEPYSPDVLLKKKCNASYIEKSDKKTLEQYILAAMAKVCDKNTVQTDTVDIKLQNTHLNVVDSCDNSQNSWSDNIESTITGIDKECSGNKESLDLKQDGVHKKDVYDSLSSSESESQQMKDIKDELNKKAGEIEKLSKIRDDVENELQDLTANLFEEAHGMVQLANQRAAAAEKSEREARMQVEMLQAEVLALKALVITSTPSAPNHHLHPQISSKTVVTEAGKIFQRGHKKSPSDFNIKYGRDNSTPPNSPQKDGKMLPGSTLTNAHEFPLDPECWEVDPVLHREFVSWRQEAELGRSHSFMRRVYDEDIDLCLAFPNVDLADKVRLAVQNNSLYIEEVNPRLKTTLSKKCILLEVPRFCKYRFRLSDEENTWFYICQLARNRIISVCDFLCYLRYIQRGLVKSSVHDVYWEIVKFRRRMALARLGF